MATYDDAMSAGLADPGIFSSVAGLPLHPLVVHGAVVLLPLSAIALIALVVRPRWRKGYGWLAVATAVVGAIAAYVSRLSGEALAESVGRPADHADWGERLSTLALAYAVVAVAWWVLGRRGAAAAPAREVDGSTAERATADRGSAVPARLLDAGVGVLALAVLVLTVLVGHSGATAVWGGTELAAAAPTDGAPAASGDSGTHDPAPTTDSTTTDSTTTDADPPTTTDAGTPVHTLAEVAEHGSRESCWAAINGEVYDLTEWISQHPGGADRILSICGTDASAAFEDEHDDDRRPHQELANFKIGDLG